MYFGVGGGAEYWGGGCCYYTWQEASNVCEGAAAELMLSFAGHVQSLARIFLSLSLFLTTL